MWYQLKANCQLTFSCQLTCLDDSNDILAAQLNPINTCRNISQKPSIFTFIERALVPLSGLGHPPWHNQRSKLSTGEFSKKLLCVYFDNIYTRSEEVGTITGCVCQVHLREHLQVVLHLFITTLTNFLQKEKAMTTTSGMVIVQNIMKGKTL